MFAHLVTPLKQCYLAATAIRNARLAAARAGVVAQAPFARIEKSTLVGSATDAAALADVHTVGIQNHRRRIIAHWW